MWITPFLALALSWWSVASATVTQDASDDAAWILQAQSPDGAIANHADRVSIWPYEGNYAAWGLAVEAARTGELAKADAAWSWLFWYMNHQDANGFVQHYKLVNGVWTNTGDEKEIGPPVAPVHKGVHLVGVPEQLILPAASNA